MEKINIDKLNELEKSGAIDSKAASDLRNLHEKGTSVEWNDDGSTYKYIDKSGGTYRGKEGKGTRKGLFRGINKKHKNISDAMARLRDSGGFTSLVPKVTEDPGTETEPEVVTPKVVTPKVVTPEGDPKTYTEAERDAAIAADRIIQADAAAAAAAKKVEDESATEAEKKKLIELGVQGDYEHRNRTEGIDPKTMLEVNPNWKQPGTVPEVTIPEGGSYLGDETMSVYDQAINFTFDRPEDWDFKTQGDFKRKNADYLKINKLSPYATDEQIKAEFDRYTRSAGNLSNSLAVNRGLVFDDTYTPWDIKKFTEFIKSGQGWRDINDPTNVSDPLNQYKPNPFWAPFTSAGKVTPEVQAERDEVRRLLEIKWSQDQESSVPAGKRGGKLVRKFQAGNRVPYKSNSYTEYTNPKTGIVSRKWVGNPDEATKASLLKQTDGMVASMNATKKDIETKKNPNKLVPKQLGEMPNLGPIAEGTALPSDIGFDPNKYNKFDPNKFDPNFNPMNITSGKTLSGVSTNPEALSATGRIMAVDALPTKPANQDTSNDDPADQEKNPKENDDYINTPLGDFSKNQLASAGIHELMTKTPKFENAQLQKLQNAPEMEGVVERGLSSETMNKFEKDAANLEAAGDTTSNTLVNRQDDLARSIVGQDIRTAGNLANENALLEQEKENRGVANQNLVSKDARASQNVQLENQQRQSDIATKMSNQGAKDARQHSLRNTITGTMNDADFNKRVAEANTMTELDNMFEGAMTVAEDLPQETPEEQKIRHDEIKRITEAHAAKRLEFTQKYSGVKLDKNIFTSPQTGE
jgi:hypothetical protein